MAKWRFKAAAPVGPRPQVGDSVLLVVDDQGIFSSSVLRVEDTRVYCQTIPAYCAPGQNLRMLFPVANRLWTLPVRITRSQPILAVLSLAIRGPAVDADPRQHPRYPIAVAISAVFSDGHTLCTRSADLSLSGLSFMADRSQPVGSRLKLQLSHHNTTIEVVGQIVRSQPSSPRATFQIALMFINLAAPDREVLKAWIEESRTTS